MDSINISLAEYLIKKPENFIRICESVIQNKRLIKEDALYLYNNAELPLLGILANYVRTKNNKQYAYFIKNIHIEYTNLCINTCAFCSFRSKNTDDAYEMCEEEMYSLIEKNIAWGITEVHIVGGIHPDKDLYFWLDIIKGIKTKFPLLHIKAFTAAELDYIISKSGVTLKEGLSMLKAHGLGSIPGGGAEIFNNTIHKKLFPTKINGQRWLEIHKEAHLIGIPSNATMLYGHIESVKDRIEHLDKLRRLQDETGGFNAFIPLKFKNKNNSLSALTETSVIEDLKMYALSRIYLDNFAHIKAYWPMMGKETAFLALEFGADDMDGTINNTTSIYSRAGAAEQKPQLTEDELVANIKKQRKIPIERDSHYNILKIH